jgi:hypothetical protein
VTGYFSKAGSYPDVNPRLDFVIPSHAGMIGGGEELDFMPAGNQFTCEWETAEIGTPADQIMVQKKNPHGWQALGFRS